MSVLSHTIYNSKATGKLKISKENMIKDTSMKERVYKYLIALLAISIASAFIYFAFELFKPVKKEQKDKKISDNMSWLYANAGYEMTKQPVKAGIIKTQQILDRVLLEATDDRNLCEVRGLYWFLEKDGKILSIKCTELENINAGNVILKPYGK